MYLPAHFKEEDPEVLRAFIRAHPLGALVTQGAGGLTADHIPMQLRTGADGSDLLRGHVARANPVWRDVDGDETVLVIFGGAQHYISPSWYPSKQATGKVVPTWNYAVVHAHGTIRFTDDPSWLHGLVSELTDHHEAARPQPWQVSDAPEDYVDSMLKAIVGFEIQCSALVGKFKASQNRSREDREGVLAGLEQSELATPSVNEILRLPKS